MKLSDQTKSYVRSFIDACFADGLDWRAIAKDVPRECIAYGFGYYKSLQAKS